ncbi:MAG: antibiotic biosynthesis monooxygenase [Longimicrobiales bacterium]|nr:antibiotic biosynthesis monooxygenase [Longimicrobiales bacterium]
MDTTISWILELRVLPGRMGALRALMEEMIASTREEAGALSYEWFADADGSVCHIYERYRDSTAVMAHLGAFGERFAERFLGCVEPTRLQVYGDPPPEVRSALDGLGASYLGPLGGFAR